MIGYLLATKRFYELTYAAAQHWRPCAGITCITVATVTKAWKILS